MARALLPWDLLQALPSQAGCCQLPRQASVALVLRAPRLAPPGEALCQRLHYQQGSLRLGLRLRLRLQQPLRLQRLLLLRRRPVLPPLLQLQLLSLLLQPAAHAAAGPPAAARAKHALQAPAGALEQYLPRCTCSPSSTDQVGRGVVQAAPLVLPRWAAGRHQSAVKDIRAPS